MAKARMGKEAASLLIEAEKQRKAPRKGWWASLSEEQRTAIKEAYRALPENNLSVMGLVRAIVKKYNTQIKESAIRTVLRDLDNR